MIDKLKCLFKTHDYRAYSAKDYTRGGYTRIYRDGSKRQIPSCTIVDKCQRCGETKELSASVATAYNQNIPRERMEWEQ